MHKNEKINHARQSHQESKASTRLLPEDLKKRYKESSFLMAGQAFGHGNGCLSAEVWDEVIHRNEARREKEDAIVSRKKVKL